MTLVVTFLRSESDTSSEALENRLTSVGEFFKRNAGILNILSHDLQRPVRVNRSGGRGLRARNHGGRVLYEAPFAEAKYLLRTRSRHDDAKGEPVPPYWRVYQRWCEDPPALDAWLSRGEDHHLIDGPGRRLLKDEFPLTDLSFGVILNLTDFFPELTIPCAQTPSGNRPCMTGKATFHQAAGSFKVSLTMHHTLPCKEYHGAPSGYMLEIEYSSVARATVDLKDDSVFLYLRLTHPFILYGFSPTEGSSQSGRSASKFNRVNLLTRPRRSPGCCQDVEASHLGGCNTVRLGWKNVIHDTGRKTHKAAEEVFKLLRLHSILVKLQRSESFLASMRVNKKPMEGIKQGDGMVKNFLKDPSVSFRAKYALEACKLISLDFFRQLAVLPREQLEDLFNSLKELACYGGTHKLFEKTMFNLSKAVDEGNIVMYKEAIPSQFRTFQRQERQRRAREIVDADDEKPVQGMAIVYKVFLTPSRIILRPPEEHGENRILRRVNRDYMLRLAFRDDNLQMLCHSIGGGYAKTFLDRTVKRFLEDGIFLANRTYEYLAASSSQLRDHGCWFYARDDQGRTSASIRSEMGSFDSIRNVGKRMAREGLCFSSTIETVIVTQDECSRERDIKGGQHDYSGKPYTFSDGIGKISPELRDDVCKALAETVKADTKPSAFQIRYQGAKGMVALDPNLKGRRLVLRDSMVKFDCPSDENTSFEVIKVSEERSITLNKPIITILEQLGVHPDVFIRYQETNIIDFADALIFESSASDRLTESVKRDPDCIIEFSMFRDFGISIIKDPFFRSMLIVLYKNIITYLRRKARISIPWDLGRNLLGVMDETGTLEYGQVYIQYTAKEDHCEPERDTAGDGYHEGEGYVEGVGYDDEPPEASRMPPKTEIVKGPVVVTKYPCVHPGDVRMLEAVDVPELAHLVDVIVFPQKGPRPHPDEMAGSDLDGDEYAVLWDPSFFFMCECSECKRIPREKNCPPHERNHKPMIFDDRPAKETGDIKMSDYYDFICDFIRKDNKGRVCHAHLALADQEPDGIFSQVCLELAEKISVCLDFAKTGRSADPDDGERRGPDCERYPDFMEKQDHKPSYRSQRVLGELYRTCRTLENSASGVPIECDKNYFNEFFRVDGWEKLKEEAIRFVMKYEERLMRIMENMSIKSEAEIMVGVVHQLGKYASRNFYDVEELQEQLQRQRSNLKRMMKEDFYNLTRSNEDNKLLLASACYMIVYNPPLGEKYTQFFGAPWILFEQLADCRRLNDHIDPVIPACPLAADLTAAIDSDPSIHPDRDIDKKAMSKIRDWAKAEGLMRSTEPWTCKRCLSKIYEESKKSAHELDIEFNVGAYVLLFIRYCALGFKRKVRCLEFSTCETRCAMHKKDEQMLRRMTTTAIRTYSNLALSGDICSIKGFSCGREHERSETWSTKFCGRLILDVRKEEFIRFLSDNQDDICGILRRWCDAEPNDQIELEFTAARRSSPVAVIIVAQARVHHKLEERLLIMAEDLIGKLRDELQAMSVDSADSRPTPH